tara:strand:- start:1042 stop:1164 length:123 start_codon:yes stop_codon:yes gene_type:complete
MAELVDAPASGAGLYYIGGGSSPLLGTIHLSISLKMLKLE